MRARGQPRNAPQAALATGVAAGGSPPSQGIEDAELETRAVRAGLVRGVDDAEDAGAVSPLVADGLRAVATRVPVDEAIGLIEDGGAIFGDAGGVLDDLGGLLDQAQGLLP